MEKVKRRARAASGALLLAVYADIFIINKEKKKRNRKIWSEKWLLRRNQGKDLLTMVENELKIEDPNSYRNFLGMPDQVFDELLAKIYENISKQDTHLRQCISVRAN
ncbi:l1 transposable element-related [Holotrichia oblita]|uniref:L1 transposable element-related n=1 Tax=Holotrichia oblita TaxID=644536 RepID=A0ACB9SSM7_HOLOL|nr:l1 transposable element-related [Holotrichia oblita]